MLNRKPLLLTFIWVVTAIVVLFVAAVILTLRDEYGAVWYGGFAAGVFVLMGVWSLWSGPVGLESKIDREERAIRTCYQDTRLKMPNPDSGEQILVFGLGPIVANEKITLTADPVFLRPDMLLRDTIGEDLRLPLGEYAHLGVALVRDQTPADMSHEALMRYPWVRTALSTGFSERDIKSFVARLRASDHPQPNSSK